jgi:2',3'-cyclic-nucleotide 2'-phosphodiesterase (5'-nucleotidase family)
VARRATVINEKLDREVPHLIVDIGNFAKGKGSTNELKAKYLAKAMAIMGYDAINLAREEVLLGPGQILEMRDRERLPLISSNLYRKNGDRLLVPPYVIKRVGSSSFLGFKRGGVKVAIIGLANEMRGGPRGSQISKDVIIAKPEDVFQTTVERLRERCDVVIVISDLDLREAIRLAQNVGGIDLFFFGQGAKGKHAEEVDGTIFVLPATSDNELGDIELMLDNQNVVTSHQVQWTLLDQNVADDEELGQLVAEYKTALQELYPTRRKPQRE